MPLILMTNDDGIHAPGLEALVRGVKPLGDVVVVAPDSEKSSIGHAITLNAPIWYEKITRNGRVFGTAVKGTPADCIKFGLTHILKGRKPDLVISGINLGCNDGHSVVYSGTIAGAREGALSGIPSFAVSLDTFHNPDFGPSAFYAKNVAKYLLTHAIPKDCFLNVNVPNLPKSKIKSMRVTRQGLQPIHVTFSRYEDPFKREYFWMGGKAPDLTQDLERDSYALSKGHVTVTPIMLDATHEAALQDLTKSLK